MKVALVHDWITGMRGGERCLEEFIKIYPDADIYTLLHIPNTTTEEIDKRVKGTSFLQNIPFVSRHYRKLLPLLPLAASSLKVTGYDLVISLSHAAAKNTRIYNNGKHVCYCFTPMRYIWDMAPTYLGAMLPLAWPLIKTLRAWDKKGARQVDHFVAISKFVAARIRLYYGRKATVIYPPVSINWLKSNCQHDSSSDKPYLFASALAPYKGAEIVIEVFNRLGFPLWCVGEGTLSSRLKDKAKANIKFFGKVSDEKLAEIYRSSKALVFPAKEDFGIVPIEALSSGLPVIAGYHGALRETLPAVCPWLDDDFLSDRHAGVFFNPQLKDRVAAVVEAVEYFEKIKGEINPFTVTNAAAPYSAERFREEWRQLEANSFHSHSKKLAQDMGLPQERQAVLC